MPDSSVKPQREILASLVVFLVALPLSLGIALASGAPLGAGLIAAAIGGLVVGPLSGAPLQVSGPAAGLTMLVFVNIETFGFGTACLIGILAGAMQIVAGLVRVARLALAITPAVVHAMLAGIGVLIVLAQVHVLLGGSAQSSALANITDLPGQIADLHGAATFLGLATLALLVIWEFVIPKRFRVLPGALVAVAVGTLMAIVFALDSATVVLPEQLFSDILPFSLPEASQWPSLLLAAVTMAAIASAESLICAVATDKLHGGPRADLDRELLAQGVGNIVSGVLGGLPITGVIVRSSANVRAGAQTRWSAVLHGVWILVAALLLHGALTRIPLSVLAALLIFVGAKLIDVSLFRELERQRELRIYIITLLGVVFVDLLTGVIAGLSISMMRLIWRMTHIDVQVREHPEHMQVEIAGALTFVAVPGLLARLSELPAKSHVIIVARVALLDAPSLDALENWCESHEVAGGKVTLDLRSAHELPRGRVNQILRARFDEHRAKVEAPPT
jgi:carbonic anhydrase